MAGGVTVNVTVSGQPGVVHQPVAHKHPHPPLAITGADLVPLLVVATIVLGLAAVLTRWRHRHLGADS
jgi:hypothetical protein